MHRQLAQRLRSLQRKGDQPNPRGTWGNLGETRGRVGKKWRFGEQKRQRVKIEEKLLWTAYRNSPTLFRTVPSPTLYGLPYLDIGGLQLSYPLLCQEQLAIYKDFKYGGYIYRANPNKSPLKILEKRERGRIQGLPNFFGYPLLSQEQVKLRTSNLAGTFTGPIGIKAH